MHSCSKMIKISHNNKTFLIENPNCYEKLKEVFRYRFNVSNFSNKDIIANDVDKDIRISCDKDLVLLNSLRFKMPKLELREVVQQDLVNNIEKQYKIDLYDGQNKSKSSRTECIKNMLDKNRIPCKHCFFAIKSKFKLESKVEGRECEECKNNKSVPMGKSWSLFFLLLETKINQRVLKPLKSAKCGEFDSILSSFGGLINKKDNRNFFKKHLNINKVHDTGKIQVI